GEAAGRRGHPQQARGAVHGTGGRPARGAAEVGRRREGLSGRGRSRRGAGGGEEAGEEEQQAHEEVLGQEGGPEEEHRQEAGCEEDGQEGTGQEVRCPQVRLSQRLSSRLWPSQPPSLKPGRTANSADPIAVVHSLSASWWSSRR